MRKKFANLALIFIICFPLSLQPIFTLFISLNNLLIFASIQLYKNTLTSSNSRKVCRKERKSKHSHRTVSEKAEKLSNCFS